MVIESRTMTVRCCAVVMEQGTMVCGENYLPEGGPTLQKYMCGLLDEVLGLLFLPLMRSWTSTALFYVSGRLPPCAP